LLTDSYGALKLTAPVEHGISRNRPGASYPLGANGHRRPSGVSADEFSVLARQQEAAGRLGLRRGGCHNNEGRGKC
jgi:hypothetical protein